ncbi:MAG: DNA repair protein RecO [Rhodoferax sp.]|jgi:DNA repair protein RecO (recombination protein O)|uniref:DNA repair protein RecO n=1 Tax=Rhodoferax sp. TaxID=50421 RepID=UPI001B4F267E|nr:DNA repair protein RecO [Rhodoferax sp.]MBP8285598.1 DNA repair protein RecO [Rhodoferax sp.]MBP9147559.1 DNA repair protein RecO [Rhodoferax sp.]MBP9735327.1 DNA repair protein RecO [Rhodoferax sp.]
MASKRISEEPAYVLHRYDWSESSLILEIFTRHHGRLALVAKGVKRPSSSFRPILLPLQPLHLAFGGEGEIKTLKAAEWQGGHVMPTGDALMSGYYLNELLLKLLAREDPHPLLFDVYSSTVQVVASEHGEALESALRAFELLLLREIGLLPLLDTQTMTLLTLHPDVHYSLVAEGGLRQTHENDRASLSGQQWCALQQVLGERVPFTAVLRACAVVAGGLKPQLRALLNYHCGVDSLQTRQVMMDLQSL